MIHPRGVRRGRDCSVIHKNKVINTRPELDDDRYGRPTLHVVDRKRGAGVREDVHGCLFVDNLSTLVNQTCLDFDQPCICGSYTHRSRRSSKCLLCPQFLDADDDI